MYGCVLIDAVVGVVVEFRSDVRDGARNGVVGRVVFVGLEGLAPRDVLRCRGRDGIAVLSVVKLGILSDRLMLFVAIFETNKLGML